MQGEIKIDKVGKIFGGGEEERVVALDGMEFAIPAGSFVSLIGPSGCGKTTLLRCIAGLETPTSGNVLVDDVPVRKPGSDRGFAFQQANLFPWLSIRDNISFGLRARGQDVFLRYRTQILEILDYAGKVQDVEYTI